MEKSFCGLDDTLHQELMDRYEQEKIMTEEQNEIETTEKDIFDEEGNQIGTYEKSVYRDNEYDRPSYNDLY